MPGVLQIEAMAQTGAVLMSRSLDVDVTKNTILFMSVDNARFRRPVRPGEVLEMPVEVVFARRNIFKFRGKAEVGGELAAEAAIHPTAIVHRSAEIHPEAEVGPYCIIGENVKLGARTRLIAHVFIERETELGADNVVHPYATLGQPAQDTSYKNEPTSLIIGSRNIIREHVSMHRGTVRSRGVTTVGNDGYFMAQSHVAHDCIVGDNVIFAQGATLGGHVQVGDHVIMGGLSAMHQYGRIGRHAFVGGLAAVVADVIPYGSVFGNHAQLAGLNVIGLKRRGF
jgi:UDP-N-acetylglucosamine acyltransferase